MALLERMRGIVANATDVRKIIDLLFLFLLLVPTQREITSKTHAQQVPRIRNHDKTLKCLLVAKKEKRVKKWMLRMRMMRL